MLSKTVAGGIMGTQVEPKASKSRMWQGHINSWLRSGLSQRSYCESCGLALSTFQWWRRRLVANSNMEGQAKDFELVELVPIPKAFSVADLQDGRRAALVLCVGVYRLEITDGVQMQTLRRVIDVLETR